MILCEPREIASDMLISEHHWDWHLSQRAWTVRNASTDFTKWNVWGKKICTMAWKEGSSDNLPPSLSLFLPNKLSFFLSYCLWCTCRPVSPRVHVCGVCMCVLSKTVESDRRSQCHPWGEMPANRVCSVEESALRMQCWCIQLSVWFEVGVVGQKCAQLLMVHQTGNLLYSSVWGSFFPYPLRNTHRSFMFAFYINEKEINSTTCLPFIGSLDYLLPLQQTVQYNLHIFN